MGDYQATIGQIKGDEWAGVGNGRARNSGPLEPLIGLSEQVSGQ